MSVGVPAAGHILIKPYHGICFQTSKPELSYSSIRMYDIPHHALRKQVFGDCSFPYLHYTLEECTKFCVGACWFVFACAFVSHERAMQRESGRKVRRASSKWARSVRSMNIAIYGYSFDCAGAPRNSYYYYLK